MIIVREPPRGQQSRPGGEPRAPRGRPGRRDLDAPGPVVGVERTDADAVVGPVLRRPRDDHGRRRRSGRRAGGDGLRAARGERELRHQGPADQQLPDLLARSVRASGEAGSVSPSRSRSRRVLAGPWLRDMRAHRAHPGELSRAAIVAFPAGAVLVAVSLIALAPLALLDDRADLDLLDPELRRWSVYVLGVTLLGFLDDALGRGAEPSAPRGWRGHARAVLDGWLLDRCDQGRRRAGARRLRRLGPRSRGPRLRRRPRAAAAGDEPVQPARPAPRSRREGLRRCSRRALPRRLDGRAARAARNLHRPGDRRHPVHPSRAGDARRHGIEPDRGACRNLDAGHPLRPGPAGRRSRSSSRSPPTGSFDPSPPQ